MLIYHAWARADEAPDELVVYKCDGLDGDNNACDKSCEADAGNTPVHQALQTTKGKKAGGRLKKL
jgi:hypothetical protein